MPSGCGREADAPALHEELHSLRAENALLRQRLAEADGARLRLLETESALSGHALLESRQLLRIMLDNLPIVLWSTDADGMLTSLGGKALSDFGPQADRSAEASIERVWRDIPELLEHAARAIGGEASSGEIRLGETVYSGYFSPIRGPGGRILGSTGLAVESTGEQRMARALKNAAFEWRATFDAITNPLCLIDGEGRLVRCNRSLRTMVGLPFEEILGRHWTVLFPELAGGSFAGLLTAALARGEAGGTGVRLGGRWYHAALDPFGTDRASRRGIVLVLYDLTAYKLAEERLERSLGEKETLLYEVHHRVKNNLQLLSSLIDMTSLRISDGTARERLEALQSRVLTIAETHAVLYQAKDLTRPDPTRVLQGIVERLFELYGRPELRVVPEIVSRDLPVVLLLPLSLLVNELVANALRHAFPEGRSGEIRLKLDRPRTGGIVLQVSDDGCGIPETIDPARVRSLGFRIVHSLVVNQLGGTVGIRRGGGTTVRIEFPDGDPDD